MRRQLGRTGVYLNPIGLGAMPLSLRGRQQSPDAYEVIHAALDAGVDFIDTADVYCSDESNIGQNERLIREALSTYACEHPIFVATKGGFERPGGEWITNGRPKHLRKAVEQSLKNLGVDEIFLYQLHAIDDDVPLEDSVGEISRFQEEGKVLHIGISNFDANEIRRAQRVCRIESVQNRLNPSCQRDLNNGVLEITAEFEMTYLAFSPVGGGSLHQSLAEHKTFLDIASKHKCTSYQVMLAWALSRQENIVCIPGASKASSIQSSARALEVCLEPEDILRIDEIKS